MTIENIAAEIVEKLPELIRDNTLNAQDTIAGIIKNGFPIKRLCVWNRGESYYFDTDCDVSIISKYDCIEMVYKFCPFCGFAISFNTCKD